MQNTKKLPPMRCHPSAMAKQKNGGPVGARASKTKARWRWRGLADPGPWAAMVMVGGPLAIRTPLERGKRVFVDVEASIRSAFSQFAFLA